MEKAAAPLDLESATAIQALLRGETHRVVVAVGKNTEKLIKRARVPGNESHVAWPYSVADKVWIREPWHSSPAKKALGLKDAPSCAADCVFRATEPAALVGVMNPRGTAPSQWRNSQQMPRWASRIQCEVTAVNLLEVAQLSEAERGLLPGSQLAWGITLKPIVQ